MLKDAQLDRQSQSECSGSYLQNMKFALTGDPEAQFVFLCNFEVERHWAKGYQGLPGPRLSTTERTVLRMEQLGALLAGPDDYLLMEEPLEPSYRDYLENLGLRSPTELIPESIATDGGTSASVLDSPALSERLRELAASGAYLIPMGVSEQEQKVAEATGLRLAAPNASVAERVNSKIYSRNLVDELALRQIPGTCCQTLGELESVLTSPSYESLPVIVKEAYGVSGKGLMVVETPAKARGLLRLLSRRTARTGDDSLHVVVEQFVPKSFDLNYQFTIDRDGFVRFDFVKEAITSGGVHQGHITPAALDDSEVEYLHRAADSIGARLYRDGFFGVVGVDALMSDDRVLYPVLEINARLNMSTYQGAISERLGIPGRPSLSKHYPMRLHRRAEFAEVEAALAYWLQPRLSDCGLVISCFGTMNAELAREGDFEGRLYATLFAQSRAELLELDLNVRDALNSLLIERKKG